MIRTRRKRTNGNGYFRTVCPDQWRSHRRSTARFGDQESGDRVRRAGIAEPDQFLVRSLGWKTNLHREA